MFKNHLLWLARRQDDFDVHSTEILTKFNQMLPGKPNLTHRYFELILDDVVRNATRQSSTVLDGEVAFPDGDLEVEARPLTTCILKRKRCCVRSKNTTTSVFGTNEVNSKTYFIRPVSSTCKDFCEDEDQYEHTTRKQPKHNRTPPNLPERLWER